MAVPRPPPISWGTQSGEVNGDPTIGSVLCGGGCRWARGRDLSRGTHCPDLRGSGGFLCEVLSAMGPKGRRYCNMWRWRRGCSRCRSCRAKVRSRRMGAGESGWILGALGVQGESQERRRGGS